MNLRKTSLLQAAHGLRVAMALLWLALLGACQPPPPPKPFAADIMGYNFTSEGVQEFYVNGKYASNLPPHGGGGKSSCCVSLPAQWQPTLTAKVDWTIGQLTTPFKSRQHLSVDEQIKCCWKERTLSKTVPVQKYGSEGGSLQVFFLPNDEIKVWVYDAGPQNPGHPSHMGYPKKPASME